MKEFKTVPKTSLEVAKRTVIKLGTLFERFSLTFVVKLFLQMFRSLG